MRARQRALRTHAGGNLAGTGASPADRVHGPLGCHKTRTIDFVSRRLTPDGLPNRRYQLIVRLRPRKKGTDVRLFMRKQTIPQFSIRCKPKPVAVQTKWPAHRSDEPHLMSIDKAIGGCRRPRVRIGHCGQRAASARTSNPIFVKYSTSRVSVPKQCAPKLSMDSCYQRTLQQTNEDRG